MAEKKTPDGGGGRSERFGKKGHRLMSPAREPSKRPKPQSPKPDKK